MATFDLTLEHANADKPLDFTTANGVKIFQATTEAMFIQFYGTAVYAYLFCEHMIEREELSGWLKGLAKIIDMKYKDGVLRKSLYIVWETHREGNHYQCKHLQGPGDFPGPELGGDLSLSHQDSDQGVSPEDNGREPQVEDWPTASR